MSVITSLYRGENNFNFIKAWKWSLRVSAALFIISLVSLGARGLNKGIDFEGGLSWQVKAPGVTTEDARAALKDDQLGDGAKYQTVGSDILRVQGPAGDAALQNKVRQDLANLAHVDFNEVTLSNVGPTWGGEITKSAIRALVVFLIGILGYVTLTFRGEWKLAIGVVVAVIHDIVISVGVYSLFQFEVTPATVIAFLTILGYSIYDTVVVYDKVQENAGRVGVANHMSYTSMMNLSMNQVLVRSINTSVLAVLPVLSTLVVGAFILGAVTLEEFSIALTVGLVIGAYSSIFVAAPVVAWMKEREPRNQQLRERLARDEAGTRSPKGASGAAVSTRDDDVTPAARTGSTATATRTPTDRAAYSRNHPPRPRKQGKRR